MNLPNDPPENESARITAATGIINIEIEDKLDRITRKSRFEINAFPETLKIKKQILEYLTMVNQGLKSFIDSHPDL